MFQIMDRKYLPFKNFHLPKLLQDFLLFLIKAFFFLFFELSEEKMPLESRCQSGIKCFFP